MIKMMHIDTQQAFMLARNHYNVYWAVQRNPYFELPPMFMDGILPVSYTVSEFKLRAITTSGPDKTVGATESLSTSLILWARGSNADTFYYPATARISVTSTTGLYEFYVKLSNNEEYISEPFWYLTSCGTSGTSGDYANASPNDDYSNDYWK